MSQFGMLTQGRSRAQRGGGDVQFPEFPLRVEEGGLTARTGPPPPLQNRRDSATTSGFHPTGNQRRPAAKSVDIQDCESGPPESVSEVSEEAARDSRRT